ncbi:MAG TPA: uracil phosphoribosyltransferase [Actinomycetota bacterium]|nr:uracil phosphoribosyltransferase [Actinomycetota bacterium]
MTVTVVDHPLAGHLLTQLRDRRTPPPVFRTLAKRLALALTLEAIRDIPTTEIEVDGPLESSTGVELADLVAVPILRAGLGMLEAVTELFPEVAVGYIGLERDEASLQPQSYYRKLPSVAGRHVLVLDPMLATGGSGSAATAAVREGGPVSVRFVCVVSAPEGIARMEADHPDVPIFTAAVDRQLNEHGYILPGLGDFGDRLFGTEGTG